MSLRAGDDFTFRSGQRHEAFSRQRLIEFKAGLDAMRAVDDDDSLRTRTSGDSFAPARYVLARVVERADEPGIDIAWHSRLPIGSGLGSGAAAAAAMVLAVSHVQNTTISPATIAMLAHHGDVVAHGGIASGLDSGACVYGGLIR